MDQHNSARRCKYSHESEFSFWNPSNKTLPCVNSIQSTYYYILACDIILYTMTNNLSDFVRDYDGDDINGDQMDLLDPLRGRLEYFFMDPIKKWKQRRTRPWKLMIQILKILVFTAQLILFGTDMARFIDYKEEMQVTLKQLFLKDWDPSADAIAYPGPYVPYAVYTKSDFIRSVNYAIRQYSNVSRLSVGPFGYQSNQTDTLSPIDICATNYVQADFDPTTFKYNYSIITQTTCKVIQDIAEAGNESWLSFDFRDHLDKPINFSSLVSMSLKLPIRTILIEDATTGDAEIACFNIDVDIQLDNRHRNGQIIIGLTAAPMRAQCDGVLTEHGGSITIRLMLNITVITFCLASFVLCIRSIYKSFRLLNHTNKILYSHGRTLELRDKLEFIDFWLVMIIINDSMVGYATVIITFSDERLLETDNYTICSLLLGLGNFLSWSGLLRYLSFFRKYNLLLVTLRKSFVHLLRFMFCTILIYW